MIECRSGAGGLCKIAHNWDIFDEEPGVKASAQGFTLADLVRRRAVRACGHCGHETEVNVLASDAPKPQCQPLSPKTAAAPPQNQPHSHPSQHQPSRRRHEVNVTVSSFEQWMRSGCGATLAPASAAVAIGSKPTIPGQSDLRFAICAPSPEMRTGLALRALRNSARHGWPRPRQSERQAVANVEQRPRGRACAPGRSPRQLP